MDKKKVITIKFDDIKTGHDLHEYVKSASKEIQEYFGKLQRMTGIFVEDDDHVLMSNEKTLILNRLR